MVCFVANHYTARASCVLGVSIWGLGSPYNPEASWVKLPILVCQRRNNSCTADVAQRKIIHIDMDAFFASVEQRDFPELRGKPVIVGGQPNSRGVVAACSYEARGYGIHSAMPSSRAARLCPNAIFVPPRFEAYRQCSRELHNIFNEYTDLIEPLSLDEAYLDVTFCNRYRGSATLIAKEIKKRVRKKLNLNASAGVSYNKFLAKIASDMDKPDGLYIIRPEQAERFICALPIRKFFGVGKVTETRMQGLGIQTGGDLKRWTEAELARHFGRSGSYYYRIARGIDERLVRADRIRKSIGKEKTFSSDVVDLEYIQRQLEEIATKISDILKRRELLAKTLTLKVKYYDFVLNTRSQTLGNYFQSKGKMIDELSGLIGRTELGVRPCRLLGLSVSSLREFNSATQNSAGRETPIGITGDLWAK